MSSLDDLLGIVSRHCGHGRCPTAVPRLTLLRSDTATVPARATYEPVFCIVLQAGKRVMLGDRIFDYGPGQYLIVSVGLPVVAEIRGASPAAPYLAASLSLDRANLAAMLLDCPGPSGPAPAAAAMAVHDLPDDLLGSVGRLIGLLDRPADIPVLAPLIEREILYRLLSGPQGAMLRQIALGDSTVSRIGRAMDLIRRNYDRPLKVEEAARVAGMSLASFHRHFKAVTATSPLQFQKQIRLQEARRRLLAADARAGHVGFTVGYGSASQFSRDYARLFGEPPARDVARLRSAPAAVAEV